jgi:hypothetical protein
MDNRELDILNGLWRMNRGLFNHPVHLPGRDDASLRHPPSEPCVPVSRHTAQANYAASSATLLGLWIRW